MIQQTQAVYEDGVLRPLNPLDLPEHALVQVTVLASDVSTVGPDITRQQQAVLDLLAEAERLPLASGGPRFSGRDHDQVLYGEMQ